MRRGALLAVALAAALAAACSRDARPSVAVITLDTTRADALSCLGGRPGTTPNLDALAARAALFTQARSETNNTSPSHVTIFSGLRSLDHGVVSNDGRIPDSVRTLSQVFRDAGYATAGFVSARHLAGELGWRGFDVLPEVVGGRTPGEHTAAEVTDRAISWLRDEARRPFFLWVHYWDPHMQYEPPADVAAAFYHGDRTAGDGPRIADAPYFREFTRDGVEAWLGDTRDPAWAPAMYAAEVYVTDREVGRLLAALREVAGDDLVLAVTGDHGESLGEHGIYYGHRGLYETQLHVPLIVAAPGAPPLRSDVSVSTLDIAPTLAELAGVELPDPRVAGVSLAPLIRGGAPPAALDRVQVYQNARNQGVAVREGDWKLIWGIAVDHPMFSGAPELYDLAADPGETRDVAALHPERVEAMRRHLEPWLAVGVVERGASPHLDPEALEHLRALGYLDDASPGAGAAPEGGAPEGR